MLSSLLLFLALLQVKHWYIDFVDQTNDEVISKGIYGDRAGIYHSLKQGAGTFVVVIIVAGWYWILWALLLAFIDFVTHYHIDWTKININKKRNLTPNDKAFWMWLGLDQLAHQLTYLGLAWMTFA
jgi:hypothetical protein